mmetsp:Transcript_25752/g.36205  ORF Transcript_25752/g.36205 Transcript_25752/m.36205 type:complete len:521 (+) Transcript_25752:183-1745(+)
MEIHRSSQSLFSDQLDLGLPNFSFGSLKDSTNSMETNLPLANNLAFFNSSGNLFPINNVQQENGFSLRTLQLSEEFPLPANNNNNNQMGPFTLSSDGWSLGMGSGTGSGLGSGLGTSFFLNSASNLSASRKKPEPQENDVDSDSDSEVENPDIKSSDAKKECDAQDEKQVLTQQSAYDPPPVALECTRCKRIVFATSQGVILPAPGDHSYVFKCGSCNKNVPKLQHTPKTWTEVALTAIYNLQLAFRRQYFHSKIEICDFIDKNWDVLCVGKTRTSTWWATIHAQITQNKHLFKTMSYGSGYWGLCQESAPGTHEVITITHLANTPLSKKEATDTSKPKTKKKRTAVDSLKSESDDDFVYWGEETDSSETGAIDWNRRSSRFSERTRSRSINSSPDLETKQNTQQSSPTCVQILRGLTCHQCRNRKTTLVNCTNTDCTKRYCEGCLINHYNLDTTTLLAQGLWSCPYCRNCCSCISCKRTRGEEPEYKAIQNNVKTQKVKKSKHSHDSPLDILNCQTRQT